MTTSEGQREESEPDYRFSLANERTFLAWIRTSLALMAAAVAVSQLAPSAHEHVIRRLLAIVLGALGLVTSGAAYARWRSTDRAMRSGRPLPRSTLLPVVAGGMTLVALVVVIAVIVR